MIALRSRRRIHPGYVVAAAVFLAWVTFIVVTIAREPETGADDRQALVSAFRADLTSGDAARLALLVSAPSEPEALVESYLSGLREADVVDVRVRDLDEQLLVDGLSRRESRRFQHRFSLVNEDDRWFVELVPLP